MQLKNIFYTIPHVGASIMIVNANYCTTEKKKEYHKESILIYDTLKEGNTYLANRLKQRIDDYVKHF